MLQTTEAADATAAAAGATESGLTMFKNMSMDDVITKLAQDIGNFFISLAIAVAVFYVGKYIIRKLYDFVSGLMIRRKVDQSLTTFVLSLVKILLYFILIVTVIGILGINTSSFIALFASAGVAIGMALSGTLQNFAGGVLILLLKPYKVGDFIEAQGFAGTVREIQIFSTIISTGDNRSIIIPNGGLSTGSINNASREDYRRVEWTVSLAYGDDVDVARKAMLDILLSDDRIVKGLVDDDRQMRLERSLNAGNNEEKADESEDKSGRRSIWGHISGKKAADSALTEEQRRAKADPLHVSIDGTPTVNLSALADSSINFTVRAWTQAADYWGVFFTINERFYKELPQHGLNFPFPQLDVHMIQPTK